MTTEISHIALFRYHDIPHLLARRSMGVHTAVPRLMGDLHTARSL